MTVATTAHATQRRKYTDEPYIMHPARVAIAVALDKRSDADMVAAAWLHDVPEDTKYNLEYIFDEFGNTVFQLVFDLTDEYTRDSYPLLTRKERKAMEFTRLSNVSDQAKLIKMYDRIDNLKSIYGTETGWIKTYLSESNQLAESLGPPFNDPIFTTVALKGLEFNAN
ncbi:MAG: HD domain-containing protein [Planctomycetota bacterium]